MSLAATAAAIPLVPLRPLAFRVGRYSAKDGDRQLDRQDADTRTLVEASEYDDGGWFGMDDESGNVDTRRRQGKGDQTPTLAWVIAQVTAAKQVDPMRPVVVVAWKESRLWRDVSEKELIRRFLAQWSDVTIHTYEGVLLPRSAADTFRSTVIAGGNQFYADSVREGVLRAHDARIEKGMPAQGAPPFGYRIAGDGSWVIQEDEAVLVREAMTALIAGRALQTIATEWIDNEVPTRRGGTWSPTQIRKLMSNARLAGINTRNGEELGRGVWEPIVDEVTFRRVQRIIAGRQHGQTYGARLLTGLLYCSRCEDKYLNAGGKARNGKRVKLYFCRFCERTSIDAETVERVYEATFFKRLEDTSFLKALNAGEDVTKIMAELQAQSDELEDLDVNLPAKVYSKKANAIQANIDALRAKLARVDNTSAVTSWVGRLPELRAAWATMDVDEKKAMMRDVVGESTVLPGTRGIKISEDYVLSRLQAR